jgi:hypothetical protein
MPWEELEAGGVERRLHSSLDVKQPISGRAARPGRAPTAATGKGIRRRSFLRVLEKQKHKTAVLSSFFCFL